jgi:hypothetical protein
MEQHSDNEVKDTIEVGVSFGETETSDDHSSFHQSESRLSSSDESLTEEPRTGRDVVTEPQDDSQIQSPVLAATGDEENTPRLDEPEQPDEDEIQPQDARKALPDVSTITDLNQVVCTPKAIHHAAAEAAESPSVNSHDVTEMPTRQKTISPVLLISHEPSPKPGSDILQYDGPAYEGAIQPVRSQIANNAEHGPLTFNYLTPYLEEVARYPASWSPKADLVEENMEPTPTPQTTSVADSQLEPRAAWDGQGKLTFGSFKSLLKKENSERGRSGQSPLTLPEFQQVCIQRHKVALQTNKDNEATTEAETHSNPQDNRLQDENGAEDRPASEVELAAEGTPRDSPAPDSHRPTAASSPEAEHPEADQDEGLNDGMEEPNLDDDGAEEQQSQESALVPPPKQYSFPKIRDVSDFAHAIDSAAEKGPEHLYEILAAAARALKAWQDEYFRLRRRLDDEENAPRRQEYDERYALWETKKVDLDKIIKPRRTFDDKIEGLGIGDFEMRGLSVPKPYIDDPMMEHQREQDRIMAQVYYFKHNNQPSLVGRQNIEEQRWEGVQNRTRKQTQKAQEAEKDVKENVILEGKRTRKPRLFSESREPSRPPTPAVLQKPNLRRKAAANVADAVGKKEASQNHGEDMSKSAPKRGRRGRGKAKETPVESAVGTPQDMEQAEDNQLLKDQPKPGRRRRRATAVTTEPNLENGNTDEEQLQQLKPKRQRRAKNQQSLPANTAEIPAGSFYSNPPPKGAQPQANEESRPSTSSSSMSAETGESSYSLRPANRKRNFAIENDPELEDQPKKRPRKLAVDVDEPRRGSGGRKKSVPHRTSAGPLNAPVAVARYPPPALAPIPLAPAPMVHTFQAVTPNMTAQPIKKKQPTIKLVSNGTSQNSSRTPTPTVSLANAKSTSKNAGPLAPVPGGQAGLPTQVINHGDDPEVPYDQMSKSQKMSWSMKSWSLHLGFHSYFLCFYPLLQCESFADFFSLIMTMGNRRNEGRR